MRSIAKLSLFNRNLSPPLTPPHPYSQPPTPLSAPFLILSKISQNEQIQPVATRGVGVKLEVVRQNFKFCDHNWSFCGLQLPKAAHARGSGGMPPQKNFEFLSSQMAKLATNIDPAIAMHNYS